eukprot:c3239_g1_i2.p1 GENE.c3239_g1_i2~~c3239_g1_i2.p1  ORF type:complete len:362 (+),score=72.47 c3239_g1_i2:29-1114(+)
MLQAVLGGQVLSMLVTGTGVFSQSLSNKNIDASTVQIFLTYATLFIVFGPIQLVRNWADLNQTFWRFWNARRRVELTALVGSRVPEDSPATRSVDSDSIEPPLLQGALNSSTSWSRATWGLMFLNSIADVGANFAVVKAYQYTSISHILVLDCVTIPFVFVLSLCWLQLRYTKVHIFGILVSLAGLGLVVGGDLQKATKSGNSASVFGDVLCLIGSAGYAFSNCVQQRIMQSPDRPSLFGMIATVSGFGLILSSILVGALDHFNIHGAWSPIAGVYISGFVACMFGGYVIIPWYLSFASATALNLSLLTSDIYAVIVDMLLFHEKPTVIYFGGFVCIVFGLAIYHYRPEPLAPPQRNIRNT